MNHDIVPTKEAGMMEPKIKYSVYDLRKVFIPNNIERSEKARKEEETQIAR